MKVIEVKVDVCSLDSNLIRFASPFEQIDSLRLTAFLIKFLYEKLGEGKFNSLREKIKSNEFKFTISSPFFIEDNKKFLPVNYSYFYYAYNKGKIAEETFKSNKKMLKKIKYFPIFDTNGTIDSSEKKFLIKEFRIKNEINRIKMKSRNVYTIEVDLVKPFRFLILLSEEDEVKNAITSFNNSEFSLGKRISIGFGRVKFSLDYSFDEKYIVYDKVKKGYHYLFNRVPITDKILNEIEIEKSYYQITKVSGIIPSDISIKKEIYCFKEGSILYFKDCDLKMDFLEYRNKYILPFMPFLIKMENG